MDMNGILMLLALYVAYRVGRWQERTDTEGKYPHVANDRAKARCDEYNKKSEEKRLATRRQS